MTPRVVQYLNGNPTYANYLGLAPGLDDGNVDGRVGVGRVCILFHCRASTLRYLDGGSRRHSGGSSRDDWHCLPCPLEPASSEKYAVSS